MIDVNIPLVALESAAKSVAIVMGQRWDDLSEDDREIARSIARAAFNATLEEWPGMCTCGECGWHQYIELPLPTENTND